MKRREQGKGERSAERKRKMGKKEQKKDRQRQDTQRNMNRLKFRLRLSYERTVIETLLLVESCPPTSSCLSPNAQSLDTWETGSLQR